MLPGENHGTRFNQCLSSVSITGCRSRQIEGFASNRDAQSDVHFLHSFSLIRVAISSLVHLMKALDEFRCEWDIQLISLSRIPEIHGLGRRATRLAELSCDPRQLLQLSKIGLEISVGLEHHGLRIIANCIRKQDP